jgi:hypothetical protein
MPDVMAQVKSRGFAEQTRDGCSCAQVRIAQARKDFPLAPPPHPQPSSSRGGKMDSPTVTEPDYQGR